MKQGADMSRYITHAFVEGEAIVVVEFPLRAFLSVFEPGAREAAVEAGSTVVAGAYGGEDGGGGKGGTGVEVLDEVGEAEAGKGHLACTLG